MYKYVFLIDSAKEKEFTVKLIDLGAQSVVSSSKEENKTQLEAYFTNHSDVETIKNSFHKIEFCIEILEDSYKI